MDETRTDWKARRLLPLAALAALLLLYALFLAGNYAPAISAPDANGYWAQGSLLAQSGGTSFEPESPVQYVGMHWLLADSGRYFSRYPPGLAVLVALACKAFGPEASVLINPVLALISLAGTFVLVRLVIGSWWGLAAALLLAVNPTFNRHALTCDAHMAVTALLVWGLYLLVRWGREGRLWEAVAAGLLLGCIPTVRYPEAVYALGIGAFLLWHWRAHKRIWLHYAAAAGAAAVPIIALMVHNRLAFGAVWRTAYALTNEQTGFGWEYFRMHFVAYIRSVNGDGVGLLFPLALIGVAAMAWRKETRALALSLVLIVLPVTLLYMAYYWPTRQVARGSMRFLLPTFPAYILAGLWALRSFTSRSPRGLRAATVGAILVMQCLWGGFSSVAECRSVAYQKDILARAAQGLEENVPPGSVVFAHPQILQHLDFLRRWRLADPTLARAAPFLEREGLPDDDRPRPMQVGKRAAQTREYEGLDPPARERAVAYDVRDWADGRTVYYVGTEEEIKRMRGAYFHPGNFKIIARIPLPEPPTMARPGGMPGAGGPPRRARPDDRGRPGGRAGRRPGAMGGRGRMGFLRGAKELVVAEWSCTFRMPERAPDGRPSDGRRRPWSRFRTPGRDGGPR